MTRKFTKYPGKSINTSGRKEVVGARSSFETNVTEIRDILRKYRYSVPTYDFFGMPKGSKSVPIIYTNKGVTGTTIKACYPDMHFSKDQINKIEHDLRNFIAEDSTIHFDVYDDAWIQGLHTRGYQINVRLQKSQPVEDSVKSSSELSNFDDEAGQVTIEDIKEAATAHNYTGNIEEEIAELGDGQEQLYMIYDDIVSIGTEVAQKNLGSWRLLLPSETEFDEPVISTDSGYYVVCARGSIQLVPIEAEALFGDEEFDEFDEEGGPSVTASTGLNAATQKTYNVTEFTVGEYAAQRSVGEDDVQEWYKDAGEPITHVYEAVNSPYVGIKTESGRYIFDDPEKGPVELSRTEMLEALEGTIGSWGLDEEVPEDAPPDYFVKSSTAAQDDVTVSDLADLMRASWESVNAEWGNSAEDLLEWQDAFYVDEGYRNCVAETAIENIPQLSQVNMSQVHIEADEDENSGELLFTIQIDGTSVGKVRTWYVADRYDASVEPV